MLAGGQPTRSSRLLVGRNIDPPKLVRFKPRESTAECYGLVVEEEDGVPHQVRLLPTIDGFDPCMKPPEPGEAAAHLRQALLILDNLDSHPPPGPIESIAEEELADRILAPARVEEAWLDQGEVFIVGAGLNYFDHKEEAGGGDFVLFPKPIPPTGAYQKVPLTPLPTGKAVCLLDYEVEIAFVALENINFEEDLPSDEDASWSTFARKLAFFAVNDVTDRESQILNPDRGYTQAKARAGYLPSGPWLVAGSQLVRGTSDQALDLKLWVDADDASVPARQDASSKDMIVGVPEMLKRLGSLSQCEERSKQGNLYCTMPDVAGKERRMVQGNTLPAGSIVLTGTPGGVALEAPDLAGKLLLFFRGGFSVEGARKVFAADQNLHRDRYLTTGNTVKQEITHLGSQSWSVDAPDPSTLDCT